MFFVSVRPKMPTFSSISEDTDTNQAHSQIYVSGTRLIAFEVQLHRHQRRVTHESRQRGLVPFKRSPSFRQSRASRCLVRLIGSFGSWSRITAREVVRSTFCFLMGSVTLFGCVAHLN